MVKKIILLAALILMAHGCNNHAWQKTKLLQTDSLYNKGTIELAGQILGLDLARTDAERSLGLGGRQAIDTNQGLLFLFDNYDEHAFWMKGMLFPIDIIWIKDDQVVDIAANAPNRPDARTDADYPVYTPKVAANKVLELQSDWASQHNLKVGDTVIINIK